MIKPKTRYSSGRLEFRRFTPGAGPEEAGARSSLSLKTLGRGLKVVVSVVLALMALTVVSGLLVAVYLYVSQSDYFAVKKVIISGLNKISREDILRVAGLDGPVNIWLFDSDQAEADLAGLSWLDEVRVSKTMPETVTIEVMEHRPKLLVSLGRLYFLDDKGSLFKELEPGENPNLVIVSGFTEDELLSRTPGVRAALAEVFGLVDVLAPRHDELKLDQISEINYDPVRGLTLFARRGRMEVKVGFGDYEEKFRRLNRVEAHLKQHGQFEGLVYINLEASPRVIVRPG
jgi:cell division protein FtsQ